MQLVTAFLGVGHIHMPGVTKMLQNRAGEVSVKSVYDSDPVRAAHHATALGAKFAADIETVLRDEEVTSVIVCSETDQHLELVTAAANAGKGIYCDKPLGLGAADAAAMADAVERSGVLFQCGYFSRGDPIHRFVKQEIAAGHLGRVTRARYALCHDGLLRGWFDGQYDWLMDPMRAGGGGFFDLGSLPLDVILDTFTATEGDVLHVAASIGSRTGRAGTAIDEYGTGMVTFASGAIATFEASWVDAKLRSGVEVHGTKGQIRYVGGELRYYSDLVDGADGERPWSALPEAAPHAFSLFWDAQLGRKLAIPLVTVREAARCSVVMERLYVRARR
ncbi:MAG TPA: Gfo/Idh/MocA family oxidoreductase [Capsulimonadaceae bacterium]|jgi:predicted dehydrogenase